MLQHLDGHSYARLSLLLDEAQALPEDARAAWLQDLSVSDPQAAATVRELLDQMALAPDSSCASTRQLIARVAAAAMCAGPALAGREIGPYRVISLIAQGGMGSVWLAERADGMFERRVALKLVHPAFMSTALTERFARERNILANLQHPRIARLYDAGVAADGQPYLALEYVDGVALHTYCNRHRLSVQARIGLFLQVLDAVQYAHANLVVHRDLKPSNILVTGEGEIRLLDFGIAKLMDAGAASETQLTEVAGRALTPDYASPEQIRGESIGTASDVYSMGVILYELLCGSRPYRLARGTRGALEEAILESNVAAPSGVPIDADIAAARATTPHRLRLALAGDLDTIALKALKKMPAERYATAEAFARDLMHYLRDEPITARADTRAYRVAKFLHRNRLGVLVAGTVFAVLVAGLGGTLWQARRAHEMAQEVQVQARHTEAVKDFLLDVFNANSMAQADPRRAQQATARELLDRSAERLLKGPPGDPELALDSLKTLQQLYNDLGVDDRSAALNMRRVELARTAFPANDVRLAQALIDYGSELYTGPKSDAALAPLDEAGRILDALGDHTSLVRGALDRALVEYWRGRDLAKSLAYASANVALYRRYYPNHPELEDTLRQAATTESDANNLEAAADLYTEAIASHRRLGRPEFDLIRPLVQLADVQLQLFRMDEAERNYRSGMEISRRLLGPGTIDTIQSQFRYANFLRENWRLAESEQLLRTTQEDGARALGESESFHLPTARLELARTLAAEGKLEEADAWLRRALEVREKTRPGTRQHGHMLQQAALLDAMLGRTQQALQELDRAQAIASRVGNPYALSYMELWRANILLAAGRPQEALDLLEHSVPSGTGSAALIHSLRLDHLRARALLDLDRAAGAATVAGAALQRLHAAPVQVQWQGVQADLALAYGQALARDGRSPEAMPWLRDARDWRANHFAAQSPLLAEADLALADCLLTAGDRTAARPLIMEAQAAQAAHPELARPWREALRRSLEQLADRRVAAASTAL